LFNILECVLRCVFCPPGQLDVVAGRMCVVVPIAIVFVFVQGQDMNCRAIGGELHWKWATWLIGPSPGTV